jgi:Protein of unknown function (DUF3768)
MTMGSILYRPMTSDARVQAQHERHLNDRLRRDMPHGSVIIRGGVKQFNNDQLFGLTKLIQEFDDFPPDSEASDLHDTGTLMFEGIKVIWRIEACDGALSESSGNVVPRIKQRVLVIMRACELEWKSLLGDTPHDDSCGELATSRDQHLSVFG